MLNNIGGKIDGIINGDSTDEQPTTTNLRLEDVMQEVKSEVLQLRNLCQETKLARKDRATVINMQTDALEAVYYLTGGNVKFDHYPAEHNPTLTELAEIFGQIANGIHPDYIAVDTNEAVEYLTEIRECVQTAANHIHTSDDFPYAYEERYTKSVENHEIQSYGVPDDVTEEDLARGEDGEEVYATGRALKAMEEVAQDPDSPLWLGVGTRQGRDVSIDKDVLFRHRAIFGQTGYGKSTLLVNDAEQLIRSGAGLCFIDPKGDDSRRLMQIIPEERQDDVLWIEPSASGDYLSGFNYITMGMDQTNPNYEVARANLVEDLKKMLKMSADYWGPRMDRVAENLITAMNIYNDRTPEDAPEMNLVDLYYILKSAASRKEFAARCKKAGLHFVDDYTEEVAEMSDDDLEPLLGRFLPWIQNPVARRMIGFRQGGVNIPDAIENNRIIIVRMGQEPRELKQMLGMAVIRRIWSRIRSRANQQAHTRKPFYLFVDEFDNIALRDETIPSIISESRSYRLSLNVANQYPDQLPQNVINAITTNCDTIISFNPGDEKAARTYNTQLGLDPSTLTEEVNYHVWLRTTIDANMEQSDAFRTYVYPPHPPRRTMDGALDLINSSLKTYGRQRRSDEETYRNLLFNGGDGKWETGIGKLIAAADDQEEVMALEAKLEGELPPPSSPAIDDGGSGGGQRPTPDGPFDTGDAPNTASGDVQPKTGDPIEDHLDTILETIFATAIQEKDEARANVSTEQVKERLVDRLPDSVGTSLSELSNIFERLDGEFASTERIDGEITVSLTTRGEAKVFERDTGSAGSGGGGHHRWVLKQSYTAFTKVGYETWLPEQEGEEQPDGVAETPVDIRDVDPELPPSKYAEEIEKRKRRLQEQYPAVWKLSQGDGLSIEAETSTLETPFQTFNNLIKSQKKGTLCVFALKEESAGKDEFGYWGRRAEQAIYKTVRKPGQSAEIVERTPTFRKPAPERGANPRFYTYSSGWYELDEDKTALRPKTEDGLRTTWYLDQDTGEVVCAPSNNDTLIEDGNEIVFESREAVAEGDPTAVPAYYSYDQSNKQYIVNASGEELKYNSREEMQQDWERFRAPFIPHNEFDELPSEDDFMLVVFPDSNNDEYDQPQIYEGGECRPLFDELGLDVSIDASGEDIKQIDEDELDEADIDGSTPGNDGDEPRGEQGGNTDPNSGSDPNANDADAGAAPDTASGDTTDMPGEDDHRDTPSGDETDTPSDEDTASGDTPSDEEAHGPVPLNIPPSEISDHSNCKVSQKVIQTLATTDQPRIDADDNRYINLITTIKQIDEETADFITEPADLSYVIGNPELPRNADEREQQRPERDPDVDAERAESGADDHSDTTTTTRGDGTTDTTDTDDTTANAQDGSVNESAETDSPLDASTNGHPEDTSATAGNDESTPPGDEDNTTHDPATPDTVDADSVGDTETDSDTTDDTAESDPTPASTDSEPGSLSSPADASNTTTTTQDSVGTDGTGAKAHDPIHPDNLPNTTPGGDNDTESPPNSSMTEPEDTADETSVESESESEPTDTTDTTYSPPDDHEPSDPTPPSALNDDNADTRVDAGAGSTDDPDTTASGDDGTDTHADDTDDTPDSTVDATGFVATDVTTTEIDDTEPTTDTTSGTDIETDTENQSDDTADDTDTNTTPNTDSDIQSDTDDTNTEDEQTSESTTPSRSLDDEW